MYRSTVDFVLRITGFGRRQLAPLGTATLPATSGEFHPFAEWGLLGSIPSTAGAALFSRRLVANGSAAPGDEEIAPGVTVAGMRRAIAASLPPSLGLSADDIEVTWDAATGNLAVSVPETDSVSAADLLTIISSPGFLESVEQQSQLDLEYQTAPAVVTTIVDAPPPPSPPPPPFPPLLDGSGQSSALTAQNLPGVLGGMPTWLVIAIVAGVVLCSCVLFGVFVTCCGKKKADGHGPTSAKARRKTNAVDPTAGREYAASRASFSDPYCSGHVCKLGEAPSRSNATRATRGESGAFGLFSWAASSGRARGLSTAAAAYAASRKQSSADDGSGRRTGELWTPRERGASRAGGLSSAVINPRNRRLSSVSVDPGGQGGQGGAPPAYGNVPSVHLDRTVSGASTPSCSSPRLDTPRMVGGVELGGEGSSGGFAHLLVPGASAAEGRLRMPGDGGDARGSAPRSGKESRAAKLAAWRDLETSRNRNRTRGDSIVGAGVTIDDEGDTRGRCESGSFGRFAVRRPSRARAHTPTNPALDVGPSRTGPSSSGSGRSVGFAAPDDAPTRPALAKSKSSLRLLLGASGSERGGPALGGGDSGREASRSNAAGRPSLERSGDSAGSMYEQAGGFLCSSKI